MGFDQQNTRQVAADQPLLRDKGGFAGVYVTHTRVPTALKPFRRSAGYSSFTVSIFQPNLPRDVTLSPQTHWRW